MLIRFVVSNFLSFDEETEFNMISGPFKTHKHHVYHEGKVDVLKAAAVYGANGAGKSNLVKAIDFLKILVKQGGMDKSIDNKKFRLNKANAEKPVTLEIEFSIGRKFYSYGVSLNHFQVEEEWLYESGITTDDKVVFERKQNSAGKVKIQMADKYTRTDKERLLIEVIRENLLKKNELLLGKDEFLKIDEITQIRNWFNEKLVVIYPHSIFKGLLPLMISSERFREFINNLLITFDTGIYSLGIEEIDIDKYLSQTNETLKKDEIVNIVKSSKMLVRNDSNAVIMYDQHGKLVVKRVISYHKSKEGEKVLFDLFEESDGTKRLLDFIPAFDGILQLDITFVIDEIDQSMHPGLLIMLIQKIMNDQTTKGQLIFTTHESNLLDLDIFRQDEIWFAEKNNQTGSSQFYSLSDFKPRYDLDIRKGYLKGRFGAIPFLTDLQKLNWHKADA